MGLDIYLLRKIYVGAGIENQKFKIDGFHLGREKGQLKLIPLNLYRPSEYQGSLLPLRSQSPLMGLPFLSGRDYSRHLSHKR